MLLKPIDEIIIEINSNLEDIGRKIISLQIKDGRVDLFNLYREKFFMEIDAPSQHQPRWHQWGIVTHTRKFLEMYDNEVQENLHKWNKYEMVHAKLAEEIDGIAKEKLLYIGMLFHDIGKFQKNYIEKANYKVIFGFNNHEIFSQKIIHNELYPLLFNHYGLTTNQIAYIGICAKYHFELGFVRDEAKKMKEGYDLKFVHSGIFKKMVLGRIEKFEEYSLEVGLLFLADSYAKTDISSLDRTDDEILKELSEKRLNKKLLFAVKQRSINIEVSKVYFDIIDKMQRGVNR